MTDTAASKNSRLRDLGVAVSAAHLPLALALAGIVNYFERFDRRPYQAALINVAILSAVLYTAFRGTRRLPARQGILLFIVMVAWCADTLRRTSRGRLIPGAFAGPGTARTVILIAVAVVSLVALAVLWNRLARVRVVFETAVLLMLPWAIWNIGRAATYATFRSNNVVPQAFKPWPRWDQPSAPRIVVAIFDQLDPALIDSTHRRGLALPAFDRFASEAAVFSAVQSAVPTTRVALPAMTTGAHLLEATPVRNDRLALRRTDSSTVLWQELPNVFADERGRNVPGAIVGWYHPYCAMFGEIVARCWSYTAGLELGIPRHMLDQLLPLARRFAPTRERVSPQQMAALVRQQRTEILEVLEDGRIRFAFLHIAIPHQPPAVGDFFGFASQGDVGARTAYVNNLRVADMLFADILDAIDRGPLHDSTIVILASDHGRPGIGSKDGKTPLLQVRFPNRRPARSDQPVDVRDLRALVSRIREDSISGSSALVRQFPASSAGGR